MNRCHFRILTSNIRVVSQSIKELNGVHILYEIDVFLSGSVVDLILVRICAAICAIVKLTISTPRF